MKKILIFLFLCLIPLIGFGQSQFKRGIMVGITDSTAVVDSLVKYGNIFKMYSGDERITESDVIADSLYELRSNALILDDYAFVYADSNEYGGAITRTYFETYGGGGGTGITGKFYYLKGNVDSLGFPDAGDSSLTHTNFIGKHLTVIREGQIQQQHTDNTQQDGFWLNNTTGEVIFRPVLSASEQIEIWSTNTIQWENLVPEEGGGEAESTLLTNLIAGWQLNETTGSVAFPVDGSLTGTISGALVNQSGKFGTAYDFDGTNDVVDMGTDASLRMTGDFSISAWVKTTQATFGTFVSNYISTGGNHYGFHLGITDEGEVEFAVCYGTASVNQVFSSTTIDDGAWHNIIVTYTSATDVTNIYIDGGSSEDTDNTAGTVTYYATNEFHIGDRGEGDIPFDGVIDDVFTWSKILTSDERIEIQTQTWPW